MLHFSPEEFAVRRAKLESELENRRLDGMLIFAPESQFWLTGYDTFGFCFFQCLVIGGPEPALLTRSADLRQAELTSNIEDIRIWKDGQDARPETDLANLLDELGLTNKRLGIEFNTHGLTFHNGQRVTTALEGLAELVDASDLIPELRLVKSEAEIAYVRRAAELADDALAAGLEHVTPGGSESHVLAAMQGAILAGDGDYPGNEFIIGSGDHALLCRYSSGRRILSSIDQLTLEWAGVFRHYHAAMMRTVIVGEPTSYQRSLHDAVHEALVNSEDRLKPGNTMGDAFEAHRETLDAHGLSESRLNACGYSLGARYSPSWMEPQMFYEGAETVIDAGMVFFLHMIVMDSANQTAMCLGRTSLVTPHGPEPLSSYPLELIVK